MSDDKREEVARAMFLANMKPGVKVHRYENLWLRQRWGFLQLADAAITALAASDE